MPKYLSNLKSVYQKTYEELKNPKSPIGIFLAKIDRQNVEQPQVLKDAVKEFIKVYEREQNNFVMPDENEAAVSYRAEQDRLNKNMAVEKKLEEAVMKMQEALDAFAVANMQKEKDPTPDEIAKMTSTTEKLKAQRDRVLNAFYKIELADEKKMIDDLKKNFKAFDHRPIESKVDIPPEIYNSPQFKFRHMDRRGDLEIPTALYGLMRFTDLLNDHEKRMKEAVRKREYEKFVTDRVMGHQAWKNTLDKEAKLYQEIKDKIDPTFWEEYDNYMKDYAIGSTYAGCINFLASKDGQVLAIKSQIEELNEELNHYKDEYADREKDLKETTEKYDLQESLINKQIGEAEQSEYLKPELAESNNLAKSNAETELNDLNQQMEKLNKEFDTITEEQTKAREAVMEKANQVLNYSVELEKLQQALKDDAQAAINKFLSHYNDGVAYLDNELNEHLELIKATNLALKTNNEKFLSEEKDYKAYSRQIEEKRQQLNKLLEGHNDLRDLAEADVKKQEGIGGALRRHNIFNRKSREEAVRQYEQSKNQLNEFNQEVEKLKKEIVENENLRDIAQTNMNGYRDAWNNLMNSMVSTLESSSLRSKELKEQLDAQQNERDNINQQYDKTVKEISDDVADKKKATDTILDDASSKLDKLNEQVILKNKERQELSDKIKKVNETIETCNETSRKIQGAKDNLDALKVSKETLLTEKKQKVDECQTDMDTCMMRVTQGLKNIQEMTDETAGITQGVDKLREYLNDDKVTSTQVLTDLQTLLRETLKIADDESFDQKTYIQNKENNLMQSFADKMTDKNAFADRSSVKLGDNEIDGSVFTYMKQVSALRSSNSKEFSRLEAAVLNVFDENGNFKLQDAIKSGNDHDKTMEAVRNQIQELHDAAAAYEKAKGSASRFTDAGKLRYRFADEMRTLTSGMLDDLKLWESEKEWCTKLMELDDSDLYVSKDESFYDTASHKMAEGSIKTDGKVTGLDGFAKSIFKQNQQNKKEEKEVKEEVIAEENEELENDANEMEI